MRLGVAPDGALGAVAAFEVDGPVRIRAGDHPDGGEDRADRSRIQFAVLGRERVDRRRDDDEPLPVHAVRHVFLPREHEGVGPFEVGPQEGPRLVGLVVGRVAPDVTTPHDPDAGRPEAVDHACGLGVVQQHDVAAVDQGEHLGDVGADDPFVAGTLVLAEWTAVARVAMQQVVQALRDGEELRLAVEHEPPVLDLRPTPVREQRLEHLSDATTMRRRVDMPDRAVPEGHLSSHRRLRQASGPFGRQDARQQLERQRLDLDFLHPDILARLAEAPDKPPPQVRHALSVRSCERWCPAVEGRPPPRGRLRRSTNLRASASDWTLQR